MSAPRPQRRPLRSSYRLAWLIALWIGGGGFARPVAGASAATPATAVKADDLAAALKQGDRERQQVQLLEAQLAQSTAAQREREKRTTTVTREIEQLKSQSPGVARDLALAERLALAQTQAAELAQQAVSLRHRSEEIAAVRRRLLVTCDRILDADQGGQLTPLLRLSWLRLRTTQVETLLGEGSAQEVQALAQSEMAATGASRAAHEGDDPQVLRDRADLLRDSADKLRREIDRLKARSDELQRRQRLRERASRVDEDLFAEQSTARRNSSRSGFASGARETAPAADLATPSIGAAPQLGTSSVIAPRTGPDPATLDGLLRVDGGGDPAAKLQALARAQAELQGLAAELQRRATHLEQRASDLGRLK